ncbi:MAG: hypothetical protein ACXVHY_10400 [Methanobacterium sp.]
MKRQKLIITIAILIVVALIIIEIIDYFPYFMVGPPFPVFGIYNQDSRNHSVNVKIFEYPYNELILDKTYELGSSQSVEYPEKGWKDYHEKDRLFPKGTYTFIVTLDNNVSKTQLIEMDTWRGASISVNNKWIDIANPIA